MKHIRRTLVILLTLSLGTIALLPSPAAALSCEIDSDTFEPNLWLITEGPYEDVFQQHIEQYDLPAQTAPEFVSAYEYTIVDGFDKTVLQQGSDSQKMHIFVSGGAVGTVTRYWGERPTDTGPFEHNRPVQDEYEYYGDDCPPLSLYNPDVGRSWFMLTDVDGNEYKATDRADDEDANAMMDALFGPSIAVEGNSDAELAMAAQMQTDSDALIAAFGDSQAQSRTIRRLIGLPIAAVVGLFGLAYWNKQRSGQEQTA